MSSIDRLINSNESSCIGPSNPKGLSSTEQKTQQQASKIGLWTFLVTKLTAFAVRLGIVASPGLKKNLGLAEETKKFTQENILYCSTAPKRGGLFRSNLCDSSDIHSQFMKISQMIGVVRKYLKYEGSRFKSALREGFNALKFSVGNCREMSGAAFAYLIQRNPFETKVDIYCIRSGDHEFLVLGRDKNSNPKDPSTWGPDAVICDPLLEKVYPAFKIYQELLDFKRVDASFNPVLEPFNPQYQELCLVTSNLITAQDLRYLAENSPNNNVHISLWKEDDEELQQLQTKLDRFHHAENQSEKIQIAHELRHVAGDKLQVWYASASENFRNAKRSLLDQFDYYLKVVSRL